MSPTKADEPIEVPFGLDGGGSGYPKKGKLFGGDIVEQSQMCRQSYTQLAHVTRKAAATMRPLATSTVATCSFSRELGLATFLCQN